MSKGENAMSNVAVVTRGPWKEGAGEAAAPTQATQAQLVEGHLGPALVISVQPHEVLVDVGGRETRATLALAFPYRPAVGDTLLVIGKGAEHYVIGVIHGTGQSALTFEGDVAIRASGGELSLSGDRGVRVSGPEVALEGQTVRVTAGALVQKLTSMYQRVREMLSTHSGEQETIVDGASLTRAKSASVLTEESMSINGKQIHLG